MSTGHLRLGWLALAGAALAAVLAVLPGPWLYLGWALGTGAVFGGVWVRSRGGRVPAVRLAGGAAVALGALAVLVAATRYGLTVLAIGRLGQLGGS